MASLHCIALRAEALDLPSMSSFLAAMDLVSVASSLVVRRLVQELLEDVGMELRTG